MSQPPTIGVVGLGRMGGPIARNLSRSFDVVGFDSAEGAGAASGVRLAGSARELAAASDVLVTVLPGAPEVREVVETAVIALGEGGLWIDLSSNDPRVVDELAALAAVRGVAAIGAPMGGGPAEAGAGTLTFFVGGESGAVARARPVLEPIGSVTVAGERARDAHLVKLLANGLWFGQVIAVTEALLIAQSQGLDPRAVREVLASSAGSSVFLERHAPLLLDGDLMKSFGLAGIVDELDALGEIAHEAGVESALGDLIALTHRDALAQFGPIDGELLAARLIALRSRRSL